MTLKEANGKWMKMGGAAGMVVAAGTEEPESVGLGVGDGKGGLAGTAPAESAATGGSDAGNA
jgi:hypothetical protein